MTDPTHDEVAELLGAYALHAVDPAERAQVEAHLEVCPRCRAELRDHEAVAGLLGNCGGDAPDGLWDRIAGTLEETAPPMRLDLPAGQGAVVPLAARRRPDRRFASRGSGRRRGDRPPGVAGAAPGGPHQRRSRRRSRTRACCGPPTSRCATPRPRRPRSGRLDGGPHRVGRAAARTARATSCSTTCPTSRPTAPTSCGARPTAASSPSACSAARPTTWCRSRPPTRSVALGHHRGGRARRGAVEQPAVARGPLRLTRPTP